MPQAYNSRGAVYCNNGEVDRAIEDFNRAIQLKSDYADAYYNRGVAYEVKGEVDRAVEDYTKTIQLNPNYGEALLHLGAHKKTRLDRTTASDMETNMSESFENVLAANPPKRISAMSVSP